MVKLRVKHVSSGLSPKAIELASVKVSKVKDGNSKYQAMILSPAQKFVMPPSHLFSIDYNSSAYFSVL